MKSLLYKAVICLYIPLQQMFSKSGLQAKDWPMAVKEVARQGAWNNKKIAKKINLCF